VIDGFVIWKHSLSVTLPLAEILSGHYFVFPFGNSFNERLSKQRLDWSERLACAVTELSVHY
jgi:hypothetical protein